MPATRAGRPAAKSRPMAMPGRVITLGRIWCSRSTAKSTIERAAEHEPGGQERPGGVTATTATNSSAVTSSTSGYCTEIGALQRGALAAQDHPADHRDVLEPAQLALAAAARRRRRHHRLAARQPVDAHVEEAADHQAEKAGDDDGEHRPGDHRWASRTGSGLRPDVSPSVTVPSRPSTYGTPVGLSGTPASARWATRSSHDAGGVPSPRRRRPPRRVSSSISSRARNCRRPDLGRCAASTPCRSRRASRSTTCAPRRGRRPWPGSRRPSSAAIQGRWASGWPARTGAPPRDSRSATSSGRRRCRGGTASDPGRRPGPSRGAGGLVGASGPAGVAFAQENGPQPRCHVEVRIERRRHVEERIQEREPWRLPTPTAARRRSGSPHASNRGRRRGR